MDEHQWLAEQFKAERPHLRAVAYRMLDSLSEADNAVQEAWLRLSRSDTSGVENLGAWLRTVVTRVCLDLLRSRESRREEPLDVQVADPLVNRQSGVDPEQEALLAETFSGRARFAQPELVNGAVGAVWAPGGRPRVVFGFTIMHGKIVAINLLADPKHLRQLDVAVLGSS